MRDGICAEHVPRGATGYREAAAGPQHTIKSAPAACRGVVALDTHPAPLRLRKGRNTFQRRNAMAFRAVVAREERTQ